jgi:uncharacterized membrane protein
MAYLVFKFIHVLGVILLVGNVTVTAVWKVVADRTRNATTVAFAQRLVVATDYAFTVSGIVLIMIGGYGMAYIGQFNLFGASWLLWGQILFVVSGLMWMLVLVPIQGLQSRMSKTFEKGVVPARYWRLGRIWLVWGILATVPLLIALFFMVTKI